MKWFFTWIPSIVNYANRARAWACLFGWGKNKIEYIVTRRYMYIDIRHGTHNHNIEVFPNMDEQEQKLILTSVFGDSSSETEEEDICNSISVDFTPLCSRTDAFLSLPFKSPMIYFSLFRSKTLNRWWRKTRTGIAWKRYKDYGCAEISFLQSGRLSCSPQSNAVRIFLNLCVCHSLVRQSGPCKSCPITVNR